MIDWRPSATLDTLRTRAAVLRQLREFFWERGLLEVETPLLVGAPGTDPNLHPVQTQQTGGTAYLHTSPEFAMKRLLAAGTGDLFQICRVVRGGERGRLHNPEFTMLEWYRVGWGLEALIEEVAAVANSVLALAGRSERDTEHVRYQTAFETTIGIDPLSCDRAALEHAASPLGLDPAASDRLDRDELLDLLTGARVGPTLGAGTLAFLTHYPASQAALARLDPQDPRVALRFELYIDGVEIANGFDELCSEPQLRGRFAADNALRRTRGLAELPIDERLLGALQAGLPACAGVAVGVDRLLMLALGAPRIEDVMAFDVARA